MSDVRSFDTEVEIEFDKGKTNATGAEVQLAYRLDVEHGLTVRFQCEQRDKGCKMISVTVQPLSRNHTYFLNKLQISYLTKEPDVEQLCNRSGK